MYRSFKNSFIVAISPKYKQHNPSMIQIIKYEKPIETQAVIEIQFRIAYSILRKMSRVDFEIVIVNRITRFYFTVDLQCLKTLGKCVSLSVLQSKHLAFWNFGSTKAKLKKSCYQ